MCISLLHNTYANLFNRLFKITPQTDQTVTQTNKKQQHKLYIICSKQLNPEVSPSATKVVLVVAVGVISSKSPQGFVNMRQ